MVPTAFLMKVIRLSFEQQYQDMDEDSENLRTSWYMNNTLACDWSNADSNGIAECPVTMTIGVTQINVTVKDSEDASAMDIQCTSGTRRNRYRYIG